MQQTLLCITNMPCSIIRWNVQLPLSPLREAKRISQVTWQIRAFSFQKRNRTFFSWEMSALFQFTVISGGNYFLCHPSLPSTPHTRTSDVLDRFQINLNDFKKVTAALHIDCVWVLSRTRKYEWDMVYQFVLGGKLYVPDPSYCFLTRNLKNSCVTLVLS